MENENELPDELSVEEGIEYLKTGALGSATGESGSAEDGDASIDGEPAAEEAAEPEAPESPSLGDEMTEEIVAEHPGTALVGLGVDIIEIARMERILERTPHFKERVFTEDERAYCESKHNPAVHYALFFAAKEAVLKALGTGFRGMGINDVQVAHNRYGKPQAVLSGNAAACAAQQGIHEVYLSLSYTHTTGVASAVAARKENIPEPREDVKDAQARLEEQFKNMRLMLDDIDAKLTEIENGRAGD